MFLIVFFILQTTTPKLDPSFDGLETIGNLIFFEFKVLLNFFFVKSNLFTDKNFGVFIFFFMNIFFAIILFIALNELRTPE